MTFAPKLLLGISGLGVSGVVVEKIVFSGSKSSNPFTKGKSVKESMIVNKECRIHKLISSVGNGSFQAIEKEKLEEEIKNDKKGEYQNIKEVCERLAGKDIFVSNKWVNGVQTGWKYYEQDQMSAPYKDQFERYLNSLKSAS
ncbi:hypothetical protein MHC_02395 [Mycoplasma haemocanis str. Illinois]|uniref:Uncharacterized protein n=1 Tax=Mycoplasma haemocanis (strain Illinois) TaxID=1111676 RepID=H6N6S1_MYCHN|nr:hypothetical protein [Mycoplasma haemocanis]AEW45343.1 hypothetical protein MHC_02395 [Mycoplasma haemocanis str. Illinois]